MKTPEEIKKGLECCNNMADGCMECPYETEGESGWHCVVERNIDALAYIQHLEAAKPKWFSVEERLPESQDYEGEPIEYIVHVEGAELATFALFDGKRFIPSEFPGFIENRMFADPITHWMPLPEPPKEDC